MFQVVKNVVINNREVTLVLTTQNEFVHERFIGDRESLTGPHNPKRWLSQYGAERTAKKIPGCEVAEVVRSAVV